MTTVFIGFYTAFPPTSGAASVTFNAARYATGERVLIQPGADERNEDLGDGLRVVTSRERCRGRAERMMRLRRRVAAIGAIVARTKPDLIVLEGASWVFYHWWLLRHLRQELPGVPIVYHSHNVEYTLRRQKHGAVVRWLTRWAEARVLQGVDLAFAVSAVDQEQFRQLYGVTPELLPNGVDADRYARVDEEQVGAARQTFGIGRAALLFMGAYCYRPNGEALDFLAREVMPVVLARVPDATLVVTGGECPLVAPWLQALGTVPFDDLPAVVRACRVGVAPIFSGSGTRLKILEYLAAGLSVVSTEKGAEGLQITPGRHALLAEDGPSFAEAVVRVLQDRSLAERLGNEGGKFARARYAWPAIMLRFQQTLADRLALGSAG